MVASVVGPLGRKVPAVVNYEGFSISPELVDDYSEMVRGLMDRYYAGVTRYTTSAFLRMKLGKALSERGVAPHIYESSEEARENLRRIGGAEVRNGEPTARPAPESAQAEQR
jgi:propionate CoA-transferase